MGYVLVHAACVACRQIFAFSPTKVPSVRVAGERRPVCESCVHKANAIRADRGVPLIEILPGAYEADLEEEVPWAD